MGSGSVARLAFPSRRFDVAASRSPFAANPKSAATLRRQADKCLADADEAERAGKTSKAARLRRWLSGRTGGQTSGKHKAATAPVNCGQASPSKTASNPTGVPPVGCYATSVGSTPVLSESISRCFASDRSRATQTAFH